MSSELRDLSEWIPSSNKEKSEQNIYLWIIGIYFLPTLCSFLYPWFFDQSISSKTLLLGLVVGCFGSATLLYFLKQPNSFIFSQFGLNKSSQSFNAKETVYRRSKSLPSVYKMNLQSGFGVRLPAHIRDLDHIAQLKVQFHKTIDHQHQELLALQKTLEEKDLSQQSLKISLEDVQKQLELKSIEEQRFEKELFDLKDSKKKVELSFRKELDVQEEHLHKIENELEEKKRLLHQKEMELVVFHNRVEDLNYEIRTLLELKDSSFARHSDSQKRFSLDDPYLELEFNEPSLLVHKEASQTISVLNQCVKIAQSIQGSRYLQPVSGQYLQSFEGEDFLIDMRRLFEFYRKFDDCGIIFFSPDQEKLLFANQEVKSIVGWTPDRFAVHFYRFIDTSLLDWKRAVKEVSLTGKNVSLKLFIKEKGGGDVLVDCSLASISTGVFSHHIVGILART